jgi:hypothetical protein
LDNKNFQNTIANFNLAEKSGLKNVDLYFNRGSAYYRNKNTNNACSDWDIAVKMGDKEAEGLINSKCK